MEKSAAIEGVLLGCVILRGDIIGELARTLPPDAFGNAHARTIYTAMLDLYKAGSPIDEVTLTERLRTVAQLGEIGGVDAICALSAKIASAGNWRHYTTMVREASRTRKMVEVLRVATGNLINGGSTSKVASDVVQKLLKVTCDGDAASVAMKDLVQAVYQKIEDSFQNPNSRVGFRTRIGAIDAFAGDMLPGELIILAGRPSMGKTALLWSVLRACQQPSMMASLEMTSEQLAIRELSSGSGVSYQHLANGTLDPSMWPQVAHAATQASSLPIRIMDTGNSHVSEISEEAYKAQRRWGMSILAVDYLQLLRPERRGERRDLDIGEISSALKSLAKELNIVVLAACQVSREVEKTTDRRPRSFHLRESGSLEQDADRIYGIYRHAKYSDKMPTNLMGIAELGIEKFRNGPTGRVLLEFDSITASYRSADPQIAAEYLDFLNQS